MRWVQGSEFGVRSSGLRAGRGLAVLLLLLSVAGASARTITLTDRDADRCASISADNPRAGWAGSEGPPGAFFDDTYFSINQSQSAMIRFPIDQIPANQRIVNAELTIPLYTPYASQRLFVWRLLADWGFGVCHRYRQVRPEKLAWAKPGARGPGADRAVEPTRAIPLVVGAPEVRVDVTRDVQFWYSGTAKNCGWLLTAEDDGQYIMLYSPAYQGAGRWSLRITYEPL